MKNPKKSRTLRIYTDASFYPGRHGAAYRSGGGIVLVGPDGAVERAFLINYDRMRLQSCSIAESLTMTIALERFKHQAVSITSDSIGDVERIEKLVSTKGRFRDATGILAGDMHKRLSAIKGDLGAVDFHHQSRKNPYIKIADKLAERAHYATPGVLHEVDVVNGKISQHSLDAIAPLPEEPENSPGLRKVA